ncbi:MAG: fructose-6-phosphate aldolase [Holosporaceae bacterium]|jgi:transaldolase|nr:fructose-6-phosphate aldolase [Holosporaceae bacterium]
MEIFLDTANPDDVTFYADFIDGVTTNPSLIAKSDCNDINALIKKICQSISGPVSVEVISEKYENMLTEGEKIAKIHSNVCVKLPCTFDGLRVCKKLSTNGIPTNMTLCFSPSQALLAAKCGATYVSPFVGRLDDIGHDGISLVEEIIDIYKASMYETRVLVSSIRNLQHVVQAAMLGADAITISPQILKQCFDHPLTSRGLEIFAKDWKKKK